MRIALSIWVILATGVAVFFGWRYEKKEYTKVVVNNIADTIYQVCQMTSVSEITNRHGISLRILANATAGVKKNRTVILTGGLEYQPLGSIPMPHGVSL